MSCHAHTLAASRNMLVAEDVDLIREMVSNFKSDEALLAVDLGAGAGTTALAIFAERQVGVRVISVDHNPESLHWAGVAVSNIGRAGQWQGVLSYAAAEALVAQEAVGGVRLGLLLVDDDHSRDGVLMACRHFLPLVSEAGAVWFHDYASAIGRIPGVTEEYPGVRQAVEEMVAAGILSIIEARGLGVLAWKGTCARCQGRGIRGEADFGYEKAAVTLSFCDCGFGRLLEGKDLVAPAPKPKPVRKPRKAAKS